MLPSLLVVIACLAALLSYSWRLHVRLTTLPSLLAQERTRSRSLSATYERINEQWFPSMREYPYDSARFRFIGKPVDGVRLDDDRIVFVEFKSNTSELSCEQRRIRSLVRSGDVTWNEFVFTGPGA